MQVSQWGTVNVSKGDTDPNSNNAALHACPRTGVAAVTQDIANWCSLLEQATMTLSLNCAKLTVTICPAGAGTTHTGTPESERLASPSRRRQRTARFKRQTLCKSAAWAEKQPLIGMHSVLVHILPAAKTEFCSIRSNLTISIRVWCQIKRKDCKYLQEGRAGVNILSPQVQWPVQWPRRRVGQGSEPPDPE